MIIGGTPTCEHSWSAPPVVHDAVYRNCRRCSARLRLPPTEADDYTRRWNGRRLTIRVVRRSESADTSLVTDTVIPSTSAFGLPHVQKLGERTEAR